MVGLIGANGAGKSTLLRTVLGELPPVSGSVRMMPSVEVAYYRQDLGEVDPAAVIYDLVADRRPMWTRGQVQGHLGRFGFTGDEVLRKTATLSGGERARVALALMMLERANLLVFDEPTNHLDVESIEALEDAVELYGGTVLLVSHDRALLGSLTTRIWAIEEGALVDFPGGFLDWQQDQADRARRGKSSGAGRATESPPAVDPRAKGKAEAAELRRLQREVSAAESVIVRLEERLDRIERRLTDPTLYAGAEGAEVAATLVAERDGCRRELEEALATWTEAGRALELREN